MVTIVDYGANFLRCLVDYGAERVKHFGHWPPNLKSNTGYSVIVAMQYSYCISFAVCKAKGSKDIC